MSDGCEDFSCLTPHRCVDVTFMSTCNNDVRDNRLRGVTTDCRLRRSVLIHLAICSDIRLLGVGLLTNSRSVSLCDACVKPSYGSVVGGRSCVGLNSFSKLKTGVSSGTFISELSRTNSRCFNLPCTVVSCFPGERAGPSSVGTVSRCYVGCFGIRASRCDSTSNDRLLGILGRRFRGPGNSSGRFCSVPFKAIRISCLIVGPTDGGRSISTSFLRCMFSAVGASRTVLLTSFKGTGMCSSCVPVSGTSALCPA